MSKKKKLKKIYDEMQSTNLDVIRVLECLIMLLEYRSPICTLLEIAKRDSTKVFDKIEKSRKILNLFP